MRKNLKESSLQGRELSFLAQIILSSGKTFAEIGKEIGLTGSALQYIFRTDDTRLSTAERIAEACGFSLSVEFRDPRTNSAALEFDRRDRERYGRLGFLSAALRYRGLSRVQLAGKVCRDSSTVRYWFRADDGGDIAVSYIYKIAKALDLDVVVTATRRTSEAEEGRPKVTTVIRMRSEESL